MSRIKKGLLIGLGVVVVGVIGGTGFYFYRDYQHTRMLLKDPAAAAQEEIRALAEKVGRHIQLPGNETPTVATVSDKSKLANQPFFARAESGDKVLIYTQAGKAILFRPEIDKIIDVTPINLQPVVAGTSSATIQLQSASLAIYNSTGTPGLASVTERKITAQTDQIRTTAKLNSKNNDYVKTMVIVLKPEAQSLGTKLAEIVKAEAGTSLPTGETKPNTDLLLILGTDFKP